MLGENDKVTISKTSALDSVLFVVVAVSIPQEVYSWFRSVFCSWLWLSKAEKPRGKQNDIYGWNYIVFLVRELL